jgi:type VI secretion system protein ImpC
MIELGVEPQRKSVVIAEDEPANYMILGDFGGRATEPLAIDRDNFDVAMVRMQVSFGGAAFREIEDFHPDRLYRNVDLFREFDRAATYESLDPQREAALGERMRSVLHDPSFQNVEAAWRGLDFLIRNESGDAAGTHIHIVHCPKDQAALDLLDKNTRMSALLNARKWRAVIGLYAFGPDLADIQFLGRMALLAAHARAPFIAAGSAGMGDHWDELRAIPQAAYLGLALPPSYYACPTGARTGAIESFPFEEMPGAPVHTHYLWANPALAFLTLLTSGSGTLNLPGLPLHTYQHDGEWHVTPCAEVWMTETQVLELIGLGLMPLVSFRDSDRVRLAGFRAINGEELALS